MSANKHDLSIADLSALETTSVDDFSLLVGISTGKVYQEILAGRLNKIKIGDRTLITKEERLRYLKSLSCNGVALP